MPLSVDTVLGQSPTNPMGTPGPAAAPEASPPASDESQDYAGEPGKGINPAAALETLSPEVLDIPIVYNIAKGSPPAVSAPDKSDDPAVQAITKHAQDLVASGFGLYNSMDGKNWVLFNTQAISAADLHQADSEGKLLQVAPDFASIKTNTPNQDGASTGAPGVTPAAPQAPAQQPESQPAPSVQAKLATSRQANLAPGSPTSGHAGAGRLLNNILKTAI